MCFKGQKAHWWRHRKPDGAKQDLAERTQAFGS